MAKGRKLTTSRSERLLGSYGYGGAGAGGGGSFGGEPDLGEEDVWSMVDDDAAARADHAPPASGTDLAAEPYSAPGWRSRRIQHGNEDRQVGGLSLAFDDSKTAAAAVPRIVHQFRGGGNDAASSPRGGTRHMAASAPVNVPDWSKILRVDSVDSLHDSDDYEDLGDGEAEIVPPHVYLAHSRKTAANSVFEGVGRTLKGRDLSRVRDAVWRQTGFDG